MFRIRHALHMDNLPSRPFQVKILINQGYIFTITSIIIMKNPFFNFLILNFVPHSSFQDLVSLERLDLSDNHLISLPLDLLHKMTHLRKIDNLTIVFNPINPGTIIPDGSWEGGGGFLTYQPPPPQ